MIPVINGFCELHAKSASVALDCTQICEVHISVVLDCRPTQIWEKGKPTSKFTENAMFFTPSLENYKRM